jgi:DNA-binding beta-propeller fold protein YncE
VSDLGTDTVQRFNGTTGAFLNTFVTSGLGGLNNPHSLAFGPNGNLFVTNNRGANVLQYNGATGAFIGVFATGNGLDAPTGLAFGLDGSLYVSSSAPASNAILRFNGTTGAFLNTFATGLNAPAGVTVAPDGSIFVANDGANNVIRYSTAGAVLNTITAAGMTAPSSIVFDGVGGMYVASATGNAIYRFDANLATNTFGPGAVFATAGLSIPTSLALRPVPEPSSVILVGLGVVAAAGTVARRARRPVA